MDSGSYDAQDRMLTYGKAQYVYSKNGELQKKIEGSDTTRYTYDYFGNPITVVLPNKDRVDYLIDGQNRRIGKKINGLIIRRWIYSGQLSPIAELDSANNVRAQFVGSLMTKDGNTYQLITDHLGSVRLVVDVNTGTIAQKIGYDEFGNVDSDSNPDFQPFAYAGGLYDSQTKLMRFGARDYDASVGRWTVKDPIRFRGNYSNLYEYGDDDPVNRIDRNGNQEMALEGAAIGSIIGPEGTIIGGLIGLGIDIAATYYLTDAILNLMNEDEQPVNGAGEVCPAEDLTPTGETKESPSTKKGNRQGGKEIQEGYVDKQGRPVTRQTVIDKNGNIVHGPHYRPGPFK